MKVITLWEPWASLIAVGAKEFETRSWSTKIRGRIAIHAAKSKHMPPPEVLEVMKMHNLKLGDLPYGKIVCTANLVDVVRMDRALCALKYGQNQRHENCEYDVGHWDLGRFAWKLEDIKVLSEPLLVKGAQGIWNFDEELLQKEYR